MNSSVSEAMIYILFGSLGPVMSSLQSEFYGLTSSFSQLAGSISYILPTQGSHASCQHSLRWPNGKVYQCMLKWQRKLAAKHWHCNICKGVITMSITISNNAISFPLFQWRKTPLWAKMRKICLCFILVFVKGSLQNKGKYKKVYSNICKMKESLRRYIQIIAKQKKV